jgi:hypothetical protein
MKKYYYFPLDIFVFILKDFFLFLSLCLFILDLLFFIVLLSQIAFSSNNSISFNSIISDALVTSYEQILKHNLFKYSTVEFLGIIEKQDFIAKDDVTLLYIDCVHAREGLLILDELAGLNRAIDIALSPHLRLENRFSADDTYILPICCFNEFISHVPCFNMISNVVF